MLRLLTLLALFLTVHETAAASLREKILLRRWDTRSGLVQDAVKAIAQTPDGYLWVATFGGLCRFDGLAFENFHSGQTPGLPDNLLNALFCDRSGRLWIGHDSGLVTLMEQGKFRSVAMPADWRQVPIRDFGEDQAGNIWVLNVNWRLAVVRPDGTVQAIPPPATGDPPLHFSYSSRDADLRVITFKGRCYQPHQTTLVPDPDAPPQPSEGLRVICSQRGGYWAVINGQLSRWQGTNQLENAGPIHWSPAIYPMTCEWAGAVVAGTFSDGLQMVNGTDQFRISTDDSSLPSNWVSVLFVDRGGTLWVGTGDGGLVAICPRRVNVIQPPGDAARKHIVSLTVDAQRSGIWVSTEGDAIFRYDGKLWQRAPNVSPKKLGLASIIMMDDGRLVGDAASDGLMCLESNHWMKVFNWSRPATGRGALLVQSNRLWAVGYQQLLQFESPDFTLLNKIVGGAGTCCLAPDGNGGIWFGGYNAGLSHWQANSLSLYHSQQGLPNENVHSLFMARDGTLWIGTDGSGLVRFKDGKFGVISKKNGLPADSICQIIEDDRHRLWLGTYAGICAISLDELNRCAGGELDQVHSLTLDTSDGMAVNECSAGRQPAVARTADGRLWFATQKGVVMVVPDEIEVDTNPPSVLIEKIQTDTVGYVPSAPAGEMISLASGERRFQVAYNAPCLLAAQRVRFKHRLEPIETAWIDSGARREVTYAHIPPGDYHFQVIACNEDGVWNPVGASIKIVVPPFIWERGWFAPLCWTVGMGALVAFSLFLMRQHARRRLERYERQQVVDRERARIARDLHDDLGGALTEISMLAGEMETLKSPGERPQIIGGQIARKSTQLVQAMDEIVWAANPKHDSLSALAVYLSGFAEEFLAATHVRLRLDMQRGMPDLPLSPERRHDIFLAVKEALNNAVRHAQASEILVQIRLEAGRTLMIRVQDNGRGFDPELVSGGGEGVNNMRERLESLGGQCHLHTRPGGGTTVDFTISLNTDFQNQ
jgi:signal transduction histidine kinase/ligand-binding sensor domain-containing protein